MSQQPEQTSLSLAPHPAPVPGSALGSVPEGQPTAQKTEHTSQRIPRWLERTELFLRVLLRLYIGLAICYAPWSGQLVTYFPGLINYLPWSHVLWDHNPLFLHFPALGSFADHGAVRGVVSGLGLLNLWFAFHDALHHWDG
jgi:hypothetical protein